jgi:hypothetical protein
LLGYEGEVPDCSASDTGFLLVGCSGGTVAVAAEGTASETAINANVDAGAGVGVPKGDST